MAKGANPAAVNGFGGCPLHYTCYTYSMSLSATKALLLKGADPSATETTYGCTPLHYAASAGNVDLCTLLLEHGAQQQASIARFILYGSEKIYSVACNFLKATNIWYGASFA